LRKAAKIIYNDTRRDTMVQTIDFFYINWHGLLSNYLSEQTLFGAMPRIIEFSCHHLKNRDILGNLIPS